MLEVNYSDYETYSADPLTQWDVNQTLKITGLNISIAPTILFSNRVSITSEPVVAELKNGVITCEVPNGLLTESYPINAFIRVEIDGGTTTIGRIKIPIIPSKKPEDYVFIENIRLFTYEELVANIESRVRLTNYNTDIAKINVMLTEILNNGTTSEQIKETVNDWINKAIDDGTIANMTIADGSITSEKLAPDANLKIGDGTVTEQMTTFFKKFLLSDEAVYDSLTDFPHTDGYYISQFSPEYNKVMATETMDYTTYFIPLEKGENFDLWNFDAQSNGMIMVNDELYYRLMAGYNENMNISDDTEGIRYQKLISDTDYTYTRALNADLNEITGINYTNYYPHTVGIAPFSGYLMLTGRCPVGTDPTKIFYLYHNKAIYGYSLKETLENDTLVGDKMKSVFEFDFETHYPRQSKFNFTPLSDAIDANTDSTAILEKLTEPLGNLQYVGGICANKKIYMAPNTASQIMVYDTINNYHYFIGSDLGNQAFKYTGWVAYGGYLYSIPRGVNNFLRVDPVTDEVTIIELDTKYPVTPCGDYRDSHHYNGVISDNGYMYCPPAYSSNKLLKINMNDFTFKELDFISEDVSTWIGCVKHPTEDKIIFLSTKVFRVWDCVDDTYTDIVSETERSCYDMVYDPRYNRFIGIYPNHIFAFDPSDHTIIDSDYINYMSTGYGVSLGLDGAIYHLEGKTAYKFTFNGTVFNQEDSITTSENIGSTTPYLAGQAIDNEGNIYGIPGSGSLVRLKFSGLTRGVPDYIVSSQYYGKY